MNKIKYGIHMDQFYYENRFSENNKSPVIILIHGGYWREEVNLEYMNDLMVHLHNHNFDVYSTEYRRGTDHQWPIPLLDTQTAIQAIKKENSGRKIVTIGHSVGGQLGLLTSTLVDATISLAPVTDLMYTYSNKLGDDAVYDYFIKPIKEKLLRNASPKYHLPLSTKNNLIIHGINDDRVHVKTSDSYIEENYKYSNNIEYLKIPNMSHTEIVEVQGSHIQYMISWIQNLNK